MHLNEFCMYQVHRPYDIFHVNIFFPVFCLPYNWVCRMFWHAENLHFSQHSQIHQIFPSALSWYLERKERGRSLAWRTRKVLLLLIFPLPFLSSFLSSFSSFFKKILNPELFTDKETWSENTPKIEEKGCLMEYVPEETRMITTESLTSIQQEAWLLF